MRILTRYISKLFIGNLVLGILIFTFVLMLDHLFELVDLLVNKGAGLGLTLRLLALLLPSSLSLTLPMSTLLAALLTFGSLSETNEITALRASGLSFGTILRAPLGIALGCTLFLIPFNSAWAPHAHAHFRKLYFNVLQRNPLIRIEEKTFFEMGDYHLYAETKNPKTSLLREVTIYNTPIVGAPLRIFAQKGQASVDLSHGITLDLQDGHIEQIDTSHPDQWYYTSFKTYVLLIPFQTEKSLTSRALQEMDNEELGRQIRDLREKRLPYPLFSCERHLRWALAMTPLLFVGLGIPLAIRVQRGGRSIGFGISLAVILIYYILIMGGLGLGQRGVWPAALAVWLGNGILLTAALFLNRRLLKQ